MQATPALTQIIKELPLSFINMILEENDIARLKKYAARYFCYNRREVIKARLAELSN